MPFLILLLFIGVPIAEIALFIEIGGEIGLGWTLVAIVATALAGTWLVRQQGLATLARVRSEMDQQRMPVGEVITGVCILVAGALLLTPGFLTDALGFCLLIPPLRRAMAGGVIARMKKSGRFEMHTTGPGPRTGPGAGPRPNAPPGKGPVIDGEYEEIVPDGEPDPSSPWSGGDNKLEGGNPPKRS